MPEPWLFSICMFTSRKYSPNAKMSDRLTMTICRLKAPGAFSVSLICCVLFSLPLLAAEEKIPYSFAPSFPRLTLVTAVSRDVNIEYNQAHATVHVDSLPDIQNTVHIDTAELPGAADKKKFRSRNRSSQLKDLALSVGPDVGYTDLGDGNLLLGGEFTILPLGGIFGFGFSYLYNFESDKNIFGGFLQLSAGVVGAEVGVVNEFGSEGAGAGFKLGLFSGLAGFGTAAIHRGIPIPIPYARLSFLGDGDRRFEGGIMIKWLIGDLEILNFGAGF